jgi:hypothetical protein
MLTRYSDTARKEYRVVSRRGKQAHTLKCSVCRCLQGKRVYITSRAADAFVTIITRDASSSVRTASSQVVALGLYQASCQGHCRDATRARKVAFESTFVEFNEAICKPVSAMP